MTEPLKEGPYVSDWSTHPRTKAGQGVGAFFSKTASFSWAPLSTEDDATQSRFYHLMHDNQSLLLGIFYAPHARKSQLARSKFYETLFSTWMTHRQALPGAIKILAGDTNLPELQYDSSGGMTPTDSISRFWCEQFMPGMLCANCNKGRPAATHQAGNTLDLIIYSPELCLEHCTVGELMATDHHPVLAKFQWGYKASNKDNKWQPAKQVSQQQFDADMSAPLAALHEWARKKIQETKPPTPLAQLTDQYAVLMGAIIKGIMWSNNSKYGRFIHPQHQHSRLPWWNTQCSNALHQARKKRGTAGNKSARRFLKCTIAKAKRAYWKAEVSTIVKKQSPP